MTEKTAKAKPKTAAKAPSPPKVSEEPAAAAIPVHNMTRRNDQDALTGHAVEIVDGDHKGKLGIFEKVEEWAHDGYPTRVIVSLRNVTGFLLSLPYKAVRHVPPGES